MSMRSEMTIEQQRDKLTAISLIRSTDELDGWEQQARKDGMFIGEQAALTYRRAELVRQGK